MKICDNQTSGLNHTLGGNLTEPCQNVAATDNHGSQNPRGRYGKTTPCGYCDLDCVYNAVEIGFIVGVVANSLVIARVARDKKLRDPTFVGIAALAFADLLFLSLNLTVSFETVIISLECLKPVIVSRPWYIMNSTCWFAANAHVALLAILRYATIVHPIRCSVYLTPKKVVLLSVGVWLLGMFLLGTISVLITFKILLPGTSGEFVITWWIIVYLLPLIVTVILHIMKMFRVVRSANESSTEATRRSISRMSKIVPLVIVMATVLPLPKLVYNCLRVTHRDALASNVLFLHFKGIAHVVYLINHFVNPFIYGFLSKKFRRSLKEMFRCMFTICQSNRVEDRTLVARKQRNISVETMSTRIGSVSSTDSEVLSTSPEVTCDHGNNYFSHKNNNNVYSIS